MDPGLRTEDQGARIGLRTIHQGPWTKDQGPRTEYPGLRTEDEGARIGLGTDN